MTIATCVHWTKWVDIHRRRTATIEVNSSIGTCRLHDFSKSFCVTAHRSTTTINNTINNRVASLTKTPTCTWVKFIPYFVSFYFTIFEHQSTRVATYTIGNSNRCIIHCCIKSQGDSITYCYRLESFCHSAMTRQYCTVLRDCCTNLISTIFSSNYFYFAIHTP